jgi:micrococcal nuclease
MKVKNKKAPLLFIPIVLLALVVTATRVVSYVRTDPGATVVSRVYDGDTIELSDGRHIRYIGIDAPETGGKRPAEFGGDEATELNERFVAGRDVRLEFDRELVDRYGRTLAYVFVDDTLVNREMVLAGTALAVPYPPNVKYQEELARAMDEARREGRGLWADTGRWMLRADDAADYIGLSKTVVGRVLSTGAIGAGIFLNFGPDYKTDFTAFIPADDLGYFSAAGIPDPAEFFRGKTVEVTGTLYEKNGPSVTLRHPGQIYVRD